MPSAAEGGDSHDHLFDPLVLADCVKYGLTGIQFPIRPLRLSDYSRDYLQLLAQLTVVGQSDQTSFRSKKSDRISKSQIIMVLLAERFLEMQKSGLYFIVVAADEIMDKVVASTTLFLEYKFIHGNAIVSTLKNFTHSFPTINYGSRYEHQRGRIEDVVVDETARGKGLGKQVVATAIALAQKLGCYKLSLDCRDEIIPYYKSLGFTAPPGRANMLVIRFDQG